VAYSTWNRRESETVKKKRTTASSLAVKRKIQTNQGIGHGNRKMGVKKVSPGGWWGGEGELGRSGRGKEWSL